MAEQNYIDTEEDGEKPPLNRAAPLRLWHIAKYFMHSLFGLFGDPGDVARSLALSGKMHKLMARWIAAGEALLRRLLLIEAKYIELSPTKSTKSRPHVRKLHVFDPECPDDWRVSFHAFSSEVERENPGLVQVVDARKNMLPAPKFANPLRSAWPLALRFEALLRAYNEPIPYARRLARRLARKAECAKRVLRMRADLRPLIGEEQLVELETLAPPDLSLDTS